MDYSFLYNISVNDLKNIYLSTTDESLKKQISIVLANKPSIDDKYSVYASDRTTYKKSELLPNYERIAQRLNINDLDFLVNLAFTEKGNNIGPNLYMHYLNNAILMYDNKDLQNLLSTIYNVNDIFDFYGINFSRFLEKSSKEYQVYQSLIQNDLVQELIEKTKYLSYLDKFFQNEENRKKYEASFNTYIYIKEYIYQLLAINSNIDKDSLFTDYEDKIDYVKEHFKDICNYLYDIRESLKGLRLSIGNTKIAYNVNKSDTEFTEYQNLFIKGLAFGTTLEKLQNQDYKDLKRLIYLPKNKLEQLKNK